MAITKLEFNRVMNAVIKETETLGMSDRIDIKVDGKGYWFCWCAPDCVTHSSEYSGQDKPHQEIVTQAQISCEEPNEILIDEKNGTAIIKVYSVRALLTLLLTLKGQYTWERYKGLLNQIYKGLFITNRWYVPRSQLREIYDLIETYVDLFPKMPHNEAIKYLHYVTLNIGENQISTQSGHTWTRQQVPNLQDSKNWSYASQVQRGENKIRLEYERTCEKQNEERLTVWKDENAITLILNKGLVVDEDKTTRPADEADFDYIIQQLEISISEIKKQIICYF